MKKLGAKWLEEMLNYISDIPQMITSGFPSTGINYALDGRDQEIKTHFPHTSDFLNQKNFKIRKTLAVKIESEVTNYLLMYCFNNNHHQNTIITFYHLRIDKSLVSTMNFIINIVIK